MSLDVKKTLASAKKHLKQDDLEAAEKLYRLVLDMLPNNKQAIKGLKKLRSSHLSSSTNVNASPQQIQELVNLYNQGRLTELIQAANSLTETFPADAAIHNLIGVANTGLGKFEGAIASHRKAVGIKPDYADSYFNMGIALKENGNLSEAVDSYARALQIRPDHPEALNNMGAVFRDLGDQQAALESYEKALRIKPDYPEPHYNIGNILKENGDLAAAMGKYRQALEIKPRYAEASNNMGVILQDKGDLKAAIECYKKALLAQPDYPEAHFNMGTALRGSGYPEKAIKCYTNAIQIKPDFVQARSSLLLSRAYLEGKTPAELLLEAQICGAYMQQQTTNYSVNSAHFRSSKKRSLERIGFVSADWCTHPVAYFTEEAFRHLIASLDHSNISVFLYSNLAPAKHDQMTENFKNMDTQWRDISHLSDARLVDVVRKDNIDILWDLSGHTRGNRLAVFAARCAPVQITWLGYSASTGLQAMDYLLADKYVVPNSENDLFSEQVWRMPDSFYCFTPPTLKVSVGELPARKNGYITFGSFSILSKIGDDVVSLWSRILLDIPGSRLILKAEQFGTAEVVEHTLERFRAHDVDPVRLNFEPASPRADYLNTYKKVDITLDTFPYPGGTTTLESLWMGVPVLTMKGDRLVSRNGETIAHNVGLPQWIASNEQDYIVKAVEFASDLDSLGTLRAGLRGQLLASPLCDAARFCLHLESTMQAMWQRWQHSPTLDDGHPEEHAETTKIPAITPTLLDEFGALVQLYRQGQYQQVLEKGMALTTQHPDSADLHNLLGAANAAQKQFDAAITWYEKAIKNRPAYVDALFNLGSAQLNKGNQDDAISSYREVLQIKPDHAEALNGLGNALKNKGDLSSAISSFNQALETKPDYAEAYCNRGIAQQLGGDLRAAIESYTNALQIDPDLPDVHNNMGVALKDCGDLDAAIERYVKAIQIRPNYAEALFNLGAAHQVRGELEAAISSYSRALQINPDHAEALNYMGIALQEKGDIEAALDSFTSSLRANPGLAEAHYNRGTILRDKGELDAAISSYKKAIQSKPDYTEAYNNMGMAHKAKGDTVSAMECYTMSLQIDPRNAQAHNNRGFILSENGDIDAALDCYTTALEIQPNLAAAHNNIGNVFKEKGDLLAAISSYQKVLELRPDIVDAASNLLFVKTYLGTDSPQDLVREARSYSRNFRELCESYTVDNTYFDSTRSQPLQRIGFVSADWGSHPVGYFTLEVFQHLVPLLRQWNIEVVLYSSREPSSHDDVTKQFKALGAQWRDIRYLTDKEVAELIREDQVNILFDNSGHTKGNRLCVFAARSSPVQVHWLGYDATTGLSEMDYILGDKYVTPTGEEDHFSEEIWRMPESYLCFTPPNVEVNVGELPAASNGFITFGSFNNLTKMRDPVVALWAKVLAAVPGSRLYLRCKQLKDTGVAEKTLERFQTHGIAPERITLESRHSSRSDYFSSFHQVDIALDPFPYQGVTTSCEALWMGLPILILRGDRMNFHNGESIVNTVGLPCWIADTQDDYVAKAVAFSEDLDALATLRAGLRDQLMTSPLCNAQRFAENLEGALQGMWRRWHDMPPAEADNQLEQSPATMAAPPELPQGNIDNLLTLFQQKQYEEVLLRGSALAAQYPNAFLLHNLMGGAHTGLKQYDDAVACFTKALQINPSYASAHNNMGNALKDKGDSRAAINSYKNALRVKPDFAEAHSNMGNALKNIGDLDAALASYRNALQLSPTLSVSHNNMGIVLKDLGELEAAIESYNKALQLRPNYAEAYNNKGLALHNQGDLDAAIGSYQQALQHRSDYAGAYCNLGNALRETGAMEAATDCYREALQLQPDFAEVHYNLGTIQRTTGDLDGAIQSFGRALEGKPDYPDAYNKLLHHHRYPSAPYP